MSDPIPPDEWGMRIQPRNAETDPARRAAGAAEHEGHRPGDDPIPADEWSPQIQPRNAETGHTFPPRPEVVGVTETDPARRAAGAAEHEGHRPGGAPLNPTPQLLRPEQQRRPLWRRPPGQQDDMGEPTSPKE